MFLKPSFWTGLQGSLCPGLWALFTLDFLKDTAEKEGEILFYFILFGSSGSSSVLLCTIHLSEVYFPVRHMYALSVRISVGKRAEEPRLGHGGSSTPPLLTGDDVSPGV